LSTYKNSTLVGGVTRKSEQAFWLGSDQSGSGEGIGCPDTEGLCRLAGIAAGRDRRGMAQIATDLFEGHAVVDKQRGCGMADAV
jgi:hypothetical protein